MNRYSTAEARRYWQDMAAMAPPPDGADADALHNVGHPGQPRWLNAYYAKYQERVFDALLRDVPKGDGHRALDIGCGAGRWCSRLAAQGYAVHGVDLQRSLLERARRRLPRSVFHLGTCEEYMGEASRHGIFDLVTSVTVLQHSPFDQQVTMAHGIRRVLRPGGHVIVLENVAHQSAHMFSRTARKWEALFGTVGLQPRRRLLYDFSFCSRVWSGGERACGLALHAWRRIGGIEVTNPAHTGAGRALRRAAFRCDDRLESAWMRYLGRVGGSVHCGLLFASP